MYVSKKKFIMGRYITHFITVSTDTRCLKVIHNSHNIAEHVVAYNVHRKDSCDITFGENFGAYLIIASSRATRYLVTLKTIPV